MSEQLVQTLFAIFATAAIVVAVRTLILDWFPTAWWANKKPFSCSHCLSFWVAIIVCMLTVDAAPTFQAQVVTFLTVHICAYWFTLRLS